MNSCSNSDIKTSAEFTTVPNAPPHGSLFHETERPISAQGPLVITVYVKPQPVGREFGKSHSHDLTECFPASATAGFRNGHALELYASID